MTKKVIENYYPAADFNARYTIVAIEVDDEKTDEIAVKVRNKRDNEDTLYLIKGKTHIDAVLDALSGKVSPGEKYLALERREGDSNLGMGNWYGSCSDGTAKLLFISPGYNSLENEGFRPIVMLVKQVVSDEVLNTVKGYLSVSNKPSSNDDANNNANKNPTKLTSTSTTSTFEPQFAKQPNKTVEVKLASSTHSFINNSPLNKQAILNKKLCQAVNELNIINIRNLLDQGANPNAIDADFNKGRTIFGGLFWGNLSFILKCGSKFDDVKTIISLLLHAGANPNLPDGNNVTVYDIVKNLTVVDDLQKRAIIDLFDNAVARKLAQP